MPVDPGSYGMRSGSRPGQRLRAAMAAERPLQVVGTINALSALLAQDAGFRAIYLSGAGVANACFGLPDTGQTTLDDVTEEASRIVGVCDLPLLVDADTGFGDPGRAVRQLQRAGAAGLHLEDQTDTDKRCGHLTGKELVSTDEMCDRIRRAVDARSDESFLIVARADAATAEGLNAAIERAMAYVEAGADVIFAEALPSADAFARFTAAVDVPVLANMTEFGRTPLLTLEQLREAGVGLVLYPLSAFRAMARAAQSVYEVIRRDGTQRHVLDAMQTRAELYRLLDYEPGELPSEPRPESHPILETEP